MARFLRDESAGLGEKLGVLLVQLPPVLCTIDSLPETFFGDLASRTGARIAWRAAPRQLVPRWGRSSLGDARRRASPPIQPARRRSLPGGTNDFSYWRLHGSPVIYRSAYDAARLDASRHSFAKGCLEANGVVHLRQYRIDGRTRRRAALKKRLTWSQLRQPSLPLRLGRICPANEGAAPGALGQRKPMIPRSHYPRAGA